MLVSIITALVGLAGFVYGKSEQKKDIANKAQALIKSRQVTAASSQRTIRTLPTQYSVRGRGRVSARATCCVEEASSINMEAQHRMPVCG